MKPGDGSRGQGFYMHQRRDSANGAKITGRGGVNPRRSSIDSPTASPSSLSETRGDSPKSSPTASFRQNQGSQHPHSRGSAKSPHSHSVSPPGSPSSSPKNSPGASSRQARPSPQQMSRATSPLGSPKDSPSTGRRQVRASPQMMSRGTARTLPWDSGPRRSSGRGARDGVIERKNRSPSPTNPPSSSSSSANLPKETQGTQSGRQPRPNASTSPSRRTDKPKANRARLPIGSPSVGLRRLPVASGDDDITPPATSSSTPSCRWTPPPSGFGQEPPGHAIPKWSTPTPSTEGVGLAARWTPPLVHGTSESDLQAVERKRTELNSDIPEAPSIVPDKITSNLLCDAKLNMKRCMWPRIEGQVNLLEDLTPTSDCDENYDEDCRKLRLESVISYAESRMSQPEREPAVQEEYSDDGNSKVSGCESPSSYLSGCSPGWPIFSSESNNNLRTSQVQALAGDKRPRCHTWQAGAGWVELGKEFHAQLAAVREEPQLNLKEKDSASLSSAAHVLADNALEKSQQLIQELMSAGLWEEDDEHCLGEGLLSNLVDPAVILERSARLRTLSTMSDMPRELCPSAWDIVEAHPPISETLEEFTADDISRSPSRMSTAPTTEPQEVPREVLEEVQKLRERISELEEHIRRNDVAKLKASLQATSLAAPPSAKVPTKCLPGEKSEAPVPGLPHDRLDSLSTQDPWSPTRASERTRVTLSSSMSSCDSPKGLPFAFPHRGLPMNFSFHDMPQAMMPPQISVSQGTTPTRLSLRSSLHKRPKFLVQHQSLISPLTTSRSLHSDVSQTLHTPSMPTTPCTMMSPSSSLQVPVATSATGPRRSDRAASPIRHPPLSPTMVSRHPVPCTWSEAMQSSTAPGLTSVAPFVPVAPARHAPVTLSPPSVHRSMVVAPASPPAVHRSRAWHEPLL